MSETLRTQLDILPASAVDLGDDFLAARSQAHAEAERPGSAYDRLLVGNPPAPAGAGQPQATPMPDVPPKEIPAAETGDGRPWWGWAYEVFLPPWTPQGAAARHYIYDDQARLGSGIKSVGSGVRAVAGDVGRGVVEAPQAVARGMLGAGEEIFKTADDVATWLNDNVADLRIEVPGLPEGAGNPAKGIAAFLGDAKRTMAERQSVTGHVVEVAAQFLTGAGVIGKMAKAFGVAEGALASVIKNFGAGAAAFDPNETRLSDVISDASPNPVTDYLRGDPDDSALEARLKSGLEMGGLGVATDGIIKGFRLLRSWRAAKVAAETGDDASNPWATVAATPAPSKPAEPVIRDYLAVEGQGPAITIDEGAVKAFQSGPSGDSPVRINLNRIQSPQEVKDAIARIDTLLPEHTPRNFETVAADARMLGMSADDLLKGNINGEAMSDRQMTAARFLMRAASNDLFRLSRAASSFEATDLDKAAFNKAFAVAYGIQQQVRQNSTALARALNAHRIMAAEDDGATKAIQELLARAGGPEAASEMAGRIAKLNDPEAVAAFVARASQATTRDQILMAWNNVLLSNPATQVVNVLDTSMATLMSVPEHWVASMIGNGVPKGEAAARFWGMGRGIRDGFRLGHKAWQTGESSFTSPVTRVESVAGDIRVDPGFNGTLGQYLTRVMPLRTMQAGDEFTKALNYQMEAHSQAYRRAISEGLPADQIAARAAQLANDMPPWLDKLAQDAARSGTFNTPLSGGAAQFQGAVDKFNLSIPGTEAQVPLGRLFVATFIRTPYNILSWVGKRTPLGFIAPTVQADIQAGGAARDLAMARIVMGSSVMASTADFVLQGRITGAGPKDAEMRKMWEAAGNKPYSIRVGDEWVPFGRFGSLGGIMSFAAVATERLGEMWMRDPRTVDMDGEPVQASFASASVLALSQSVMDKTFMTGAARLIAALADSEHKGDTWLRGALSSWVPAVSAAGARASDDYVRRVDDIWSAVAARIPGLADNLEPALDVWGRPRRQDGGFWHMLSPSIPSPVKSDPISQWMMDTRKTISPVQRAQSFGSVAGQSVSIELSPADHNRLISLRGNEGKWFAGPGGQRMGAHDYLNAIVEGRVPGVSREWERSSDDVRELMVGKVMRGALTSAKAQLLQENHGLRSLVEQQSRARANEVTTPRANPPQMQ